MAPPIKLWKAGENEVLGEAIFSPTYAGPPDSRHKERLRSREAMVIKNFQSFSAEALKPFMTAIEAGRKEAVNEKC